jgi:hypothetical protein
VNDHERYLLLAAKRLSEPLTREEDAELEAHLASCPSCRAIAAGMRRDDIRLHAALTPVPVAPRVRERVLAEAAGSSPRRAAGRFGLLLAAAVGIGVLAVPFIAGRPSNQAPSAQPSPSPTVSASPSSSPSASPSASESIEPPPSGPSAAPLPTGTGPFVNGNYTYASRRDSVAARIKDGEAVGEWWRTTIVSGKQESYGGPITCLVFDGKVAYLAGPATTATDGRTNLAIYFQLRDRGANGEGDQAIGYLSNPGQTLTTMQTWCETKYTPDPPSPLTSGDVVVEPEGR